MYFLIWRDILVRYKQTVVGAAWVLIQPLASMLVFTFVFGRILSLPGEEVPYPVFCYTALVLWGFFSNSVGHSAFSLLDNQRLVTKVYFPRLLIPLSAQLSHLPDFVAASSLILLFIPYYGMSISPHFWAAPVMLLMCLSASLGTGFLLAALNVRYRDFRYVVPFLLQTWFFASPVVYSIKVIPEEWRPFLALNPMVGAIEGFRWCLIGTSLSPWPLVAVSWASALLMLVFGCAYFLKVERSFADFI